jgi:signal transduction histidine kinase
VLDELGRMSEMVNSLLLLGRSMEPDFLQEEPVDVRALLAEVHDAATVLAPRQWSMGEVADVVVWGDAGKLRGALLNVVDNAAKATAEGDRVTLSAVLDPVRRSVVLAVDDSGPGIPEALRATVVQRFERIPGRTAPGSGLGLAIVDAVARRHNGWVEIADSALGGARVAIVLPDWRRWQAAAEP